MSLYKGICVIEAGAVLDELLVKRVSPQLMGNYNRRKEKRKTRGKTKAMIRRISETDVKGKRD